VRRYATVVVHSWFFRAVDQFSSFAMISITRGSVSNAACAFRNASLGQLRLGDEIPHPSSEDINCCLCVFVSHSIPDFAFDI
jgi:hypothetical protein